MTQLTDVERALSSIAEEAASLKAMNASRTRRGFLRRVVTLGLTFAGVAEGSNGVAAGKDKCKGRCKGNAKCKCNGKGKCKCIGGSVVDLPPPPDPPTPPPTPKPDLVWIGDDALTGGGLTWSGTRYFLDGIVKNVGSADSKPCRADYLVNGSIAKSNNIPALSPGQVHQIPRYLFTPGLTPWLQGCANNPNVDQVVGVVDAGDEVSESNGSNNTHAFYAGRC